MSEELNPMSMFDIFGAAQETLEEATAKKNKEKSTRMDRMRFDKEGSYPIRILPIAPTIGEDKKPVIDRKGYEYPVKELLLKINVGKDDKGKDKFVYQPICHISHVFPQQQDLIDLYVNLACDKYADNEDLCKKLRSSSFNGGLKYDSKRYMYVFDLQDKEAGIKILSLSFSQYRTLEDSKLSIWAKLRVQNPKATCPICSPMGAYAVEVKRQKNNNKVEYSFLVDTISAPMPLTQEELQTLFDAPRLPDTLYQYRRANLEATEVFLKQVDETYDINIMSNPKIKECIEQISTLLGSDNSHWTAGKKKDSEDDKDGANSLDALWDRYQDLEDLGIDDHSPEGQDLRASIREYIDAHELDIKVGRKTTNLEILQAIDDIEKGDDDEEDEDYDDEIPETSVSEEEPAEPEPDDDPEEEKEPEPEVTPVVNRRSSRNDDTNEPAVRTERRAARERRRRL